MKKIFTLQSIAIFLFSAAYCQAGRVSGTVTDGASKAMHSATVSLLKAKDSSIVKFAPTDKNGGYEFLNVKDGRYLVSATNVGYGKTISRTFEISVSNNNASIPVWS